MLTRLSVVCLLAVAFQIAAAGQQRIYIAPDDHTDYMWTGDEAAYRRSFVRMLDYYLDLADKTSHELPQFQSRWHADGSFWIWTYERDRSPADFARLIARIRDGHITFPLNALVSTYGGTPTEAVLRGMYYAGSLERRFGLTIPLAMANEDQTLPYGLGALWSGAGAKYSWKGICGCASKIDFYGKRPHDIYWWVGADGSRILMKWNALTPGRELLGNYLEARHPSKAIEYVESDPAFKAAYPYPVIGIFGKGGDDLETLTDEFLTVAKKETTPERKVIVSNMVDFFQDFEKNYGEALPSFSGSFGNEWDLYPASVSEISARVRRAVEKLRAAEALASLVSMKQPAFLQRRQAARDLAWMSLGMFWEHDWTADGPISRGDRAAWGRKVAGQVETYVDTLHADAAAVLAGMIRTSPGTQRFYAFNPLGWTRSSAADVLYTGSAPVHVVDLSTGLETPSQIVHLPEGGRFLRIWASDLPSVGYKVYEVRSGQGQAYSSAALAQENVIENSRYRVKVSGNGSIRSLIDKTQDNREFAGSYLNELGPGGGRVEVENAGSVSVTLRATSNGPLTHISRITLFRDSDLIDIRNDIDQNFDGTHTWSFDFNLTAPDVWHEESGAVIRARTLDQGGHYSPTMSRLEWLTLNHFADMSGAGGAGATLSSSDLSFMKLGNSSMVDAQPRLDTETPRIQVLAGGQIDGASLGIPNQGGDAHFLQRFGLRIHRGFNATQAMKFALEHQNPPVTAWLGGGTAYPETSYSLLSVSNPDVLLWALKPADDGMEKGLVMRTWNLSATRESYEVSLQGGVSAAIRATHIETDIEPLPVSAGRLSVATAPAQIQTVRLVPADAAANTPAATPNQR